MKDYNGGSTQRIQELRSKIHYGGYHICTDRARIITEAYKKYESQPIIMKRALAFRDILEQQRIYHVDGDMLAGNQASILGAAPVFPEYAVDWILEELNEIDQRSGDKFDASEEDQRILKEVLPWWKGKTLQDHAFAIYPPETKALIDIGVIRAGHMNEMGDGHIVVGYDKVLAEGLIGFRERIAAKRASLNLANFDEAKQDIFLQAADITLEAVVNFAHRHAVFVRSLAENEKDPKKKAELLRTAEACEWVPEHPARNFYEGLQSYWMVMVCQNIESSGQSVSCGRLDQWLYPLYKEEVAGGTSEDDMMELLENFWIKLYSVRKFRSWKNSKYAPGAPMYENVTIGGQTVDGKDATNELSYLILRTVGRIHLTAPNLTVRYHKGISHEFMQECIETLRKGSGMPAFVNDELIIPSLIRVGVAKEDAYNYSPVGCIETCIPGKFGHRPTGAAFLNFSKILNIVMRGGYDDVSGTQIYQAKPFKDMTSYEELFSAYIEAMKYFTKQSIIADTYSDMNIEDVAPESLTAILTEDCLERGKNIKEGGAHYDYTSGLQVGIANNGNALEAIKKLVFEEKRLTPQELQEALDTDFAGVRGEEIRQMLLNAAPKFGNAIDEVDDLTAEAYNVYLDELPKYHNTRYGRGPVGGTYYGSSVSVAANVSMGLVVSATADGRKAYTPLAEGNSPTQGTDHKGMTGVFNSVGRIPSEKIVGGVLLNQKLAPALVASQEDRNKFESIIRTFFDTLHGFHVQYNIVDCETLLDAQKNPEKHRDLIVRVAGYSAFFTILSPIIQDDIISRTENTF